MNHTLISCLGAESFIFRPLGEGKEDLTRVGQLLEISAQIFVKISPIIISSKSSTGLFVLVNSLLKPSVAM